MVTPVHPAAAAATAAAAAPAFAFTPPPPLALMRPPLLVVTVVAASTLVVVHSTAALRVLLSVKIASSFEASVGQEGHRNIKRGGGRGTRRKNDRRKQHAFERKSNLVLAAGAARQVYTG